LYRVLLGTALLKQLGNLSSPGYQMAKALLPMVCTLPMPIPDPLTALLVGGWRCEASL